MFRWSTGTTGIKASAVGEFLFMWLELNGFRRISKAIQYCALSYTALILGGLALAVLLNVAALGLNELNARTVHAGTAFSAR
jgi:hypothetical protein